MNILMSNAFESWAMAIKYHNYILDGWISLNTKKVFVQSLHNACELILKQIMLNTKNPFIIPYPEEPNKKEKIKIKSDLKKIEKDSTIMYFNNYFNDLEFMPETIHFSKIIRHLEKNLRPIPIDDEELSEITSIKILKENLYTLNKLRNNSTHFYIKSFDFLS